MSSRRKEELLTYYLSIEDRHDALTNDISQIPSMIECESGDRIATIIALDNLDTHIHHHFSCEEHLMSEINYPMIEDHKEHHKSLIIELAFQKNRYKNATEPETSDIAGFIQRWLAKHEQEHDQPLMKFIKYAIDLKTDHGAFQSA